MSTNAITLDNILNKTDAESLEYLKILTNAACKNWNIQVWTTYLEVYTLHNTLSDISGRISVKKPRPDERGEGEASLLVDKGPKSNVAMKNFRKTLQLRTTKNEEQQRRTIFVQ